jgi:hypothetical protein
MSQVLKELHQAWIVSPFFRPYRFATSRIAHGKRSRLRKKVRFRINIRSLELDMSEPRSNRINIYSRAEQMRCGCVANRVWTNPFPFSKRGPSERLTNRRPQAATFDQIKSSLEIKFPKNGANHDTDTHWLVVRIWSFRLEIRARQSALQ